MNSGSNDKAHYNWINRILLQKHENSTTVARYGHHISSAMLGHHIHVKWESRFQVFLRTLELKGVIMNDSLKTLLAPMHSLNTFSEPV